MNIVLVPAGDVMRGDGAREQEILKLDIIFFNLDIHNSQHLYLLCINHDVGSNKL